MNTQKPDLLRKFILLLACGLAFWGCDLFSGGDDHTSLKAAKQPKLLNIEQNDAIEYISELRRGSGLYGLRVNNLLAAAAQNHANYSVANSALGHDETAGRPNFTGTNVSERTKFAGYSYAGTLENIAHKDGKLSPADAVDGLFSAIYHRFMFLNPTIDEMGQGVASDAKSSAYVFVAGNSMIESFCKAGSSDAGSGLFYTRICADASLKMSEQKYKRYIKFSQDHIKFPDRIAVQPHFSREMPDPFPECKITANPVSIELHPKFGEIKMQNFELFKDGVKIENTKLIDAQSDVNRLFSPRQFAVFAYEPFEFDTGYRAVFSYTAGGKPARIEWDFRTKTPNLPYFDLRGGEQIALMADREYELFFRPRDCGDMSLRYDVRTSSYTAHTKLSNGGTNTLRLRLSGLKGDTAQIVTDTGVRVQAVLISSSPEAQKRQQIYIIIAAAAGVAAVLVLGFFFWRRI